MNTLDLVDEMQWEDCEKVEFISLEAAGLEVRDYDTIPFTQRLYYTDEGEQ
jgi:hypothetical protein